MRRPVLYLAAGATVLVAAAVPALWLQLTPGSTFGIPRDAQAVRGFDLLREAVGPGAVSPTQVLVDTGRAGGARDAARRARRSAGSPPRSGATRRSPRVYAAGGRRSSTRAAATRR